MTENALTPQQEEMRAIAVAQQDATDFLRKLTPQITKALPNAVSADRFVRTVMTAVRINPRLVESYRSAPDAFFGAILQCAQFGLLPNDGLGNAYLIPRKNRKTGRLETNVQLGYKGLRKLAKRSGDAAFITTGTRRAQDKWTYRKSPPVLQHEPYDGPPDEAGEVRCYYAAAYQRLPVDANGELTSVELVACDVMWPEEIEAIRKRYSESSKKGFGPWKENYDAMARKTVLRRLCNQQLDLEAESILGHAARLDEEAEREEGQQYSLEVLEQLAKARAETKQIEASSGPVYPDEEPARPASAHATEPAASGIDGSFAL